MKLEVFVVKTFVKFATAATGKHVRQRPSRRNEKKTSLRLKRQQRDALKASFGYVGFCKKFFVSWTNPILPAVRILSRIQSSKRFVLLDNGMNATHEVSSQLARVGFEHWARKMERCGQEL